MIQLVRYLHEPKISTKGREFGWGATGLSMNNEFALESNIIWVKSS